MIKKNIPITLTIENPETEEFIDITVIVDIIWVQGNPPNDYEPYGTEDDYDFIIKNFEAPESITFGMIEEELWDLDLRKFFY